MDAHSYETLAQLQLVIAESLRLHGDGELAIDYANQYDIDFLVNATMYLYQDSSNQPSAALNPLLAIIEKGTVLGRLDEQDTARLQIIADCAEQLLTGSELNHQHLKELRDVLIEIQSARFQAAGEAWLAS